MSTGLSVGVYRVVVGRYPAGALGAGSIVVLGPV